MSHLDTDSGQATAGEAGGEAQSRSPQLLAHTRARVTHWYPGSVIERLWRRLDAMDFMNRGMLFAAVLLLCFVPFMIVVQALAGRSAAAGLVRRFGLDQEAAHAVSQVLASPEATSTAITGLSWVFFVLGGIAAAAALQELYQGAFGVAGRGLKDTPRRIAWVVVLLATGAFAGWAMPWLKDVGGPVLVGAFVLVGAIAFWWLSMRLLLGGRLSWTDLFPSAVATGVCWLGMDLVFRMIMSGTISSDYAKYGSIGVVFAIMSFLIAIGVVVILGAIVGALWRERRLDRRADSSTSAADGDA